MLETLKFLARFAMGDLTEEERKVGWKLTTTVGYRAVMVGLMCWAYGLGIYIGMGSGFAKADNVQGEIQAAIKPIFDAQTQQAGAINEQARSIRELTAVLNDQIASSIATEIRYLYFKRCTEKNVFEREQAQKEIDRKQGEYRRYSRSSEKYYYGCGDV